MSDIEEAARLIVSRFSQVAVRGGHQDGAWDCVAYDAIRSAAGMNPNELLDMAEERFWRIQLPGGVPVGFDTKRACFELAGALKAAADELGLQPPEGTPPHKADGATLLVEGTDDEACDLPPVVFEYRNWRGEVRVRKARPVRMVFGSNEWHPEKQWMMEAMDVETGDVRTFALSGILRYLPDQQPSLTGEAR